MGGYCSLLHVPNLGVPHKTKGKPQVHVVGLSGPDVHSFLAPPHPPSVNSVHHSCHFLESVCVREDVTSLCHCGWVWVCGWECFHSSSPHLYSSRFTAVCECDKYGYISNYSPEEEGPCSAAPIILVREESHVSTEDWYVTVESESVIERMSHSYLSEVVRGMLAECVWSTWQKAHAIGSQIRIQIQLSGHNCHTFLLEVFRLLLEPAYSGTLGPLEHKKGCLPQIFGLWVTSTGLHMLFNAISQLGISPTIVARCVIDHRLCTYVITVLE